jgi:hypothetical protein
VYKQKLQKIIERQLKDAREHKKDAQGLADNAYWDGHIEAYEEILAFSKVVNDL